MPIEHIKEVFDVNVYGAIFMVRAVVPHMPPGGRIINITSICSKLGLAMMTIYGASKAAVDNLSSVWADEVLDSDLTNEQQLMHITVWQEPRYYGQFYCSGTCPYP